jgi:hypothetical protein
MPRGNIAAVGQTCPKATLAALGQARLGTGQRGEKSFEKRVQEEGCDCPYSNRTNVILEHNAFLDQ